MNLNTFAERTKWARTQVNPALSQKALAKLIGVTPATINKIESGALKSTTKLVELAECLNVDINWLSTGSGSPEKSTVKLLKLSHLEDTLDKLGLNDDELLRVEKAALDEAMKIILEKR
ncbi:helix-turn-helix domain-containing protein [Photobacterium indicum]|uniref:HTH cro/C1-type domain-containing protein n=1 Tax=Photobacterium indicum TaxID=81447 RepID=A0A2T3LF47_9GAMM|nr:helix-turn-helix domain-containing protein [Photobacterium indicum]PSV50005.1 hypothetical protein C9J47_05505 [Photobacterium indicum]